MKPNEFDVIIIGGGITGAGTQRDCAMRGLRTLLVDRSDIATGATACCTRGRGMPSTMRNPARNVSGKT